MTTLAISSLEDLDLDWLRNNNYQAHFFGLGFIQVKLTPTQRLHFYHPSLPAFVESPHDHRYHFLSKVIKGGLYYDVWDTDDVEGSKFVAEIESCKAPGSDDSVDIPPETVLRLSHVGTYYAHMCSSYFMNMNTFHTVSPDFLVGPCITFLTRTSPQKKLARVIQTMEKVCPFLSKSLKTSFGL